MKKRVPWSEQKDIVDDIKAFIKRHYYFGVGLFLVFLPLLSFALVAKDMDQYKILVRQYSLVIVAGLFIIYKSNPIRNRMGSGSTDDSNDK